MMMMMMMMIIAFEIKKLWKMKRVKVVPIVIGALGTAKETRGTPNRHQCWNRIGSAPKDSAAGISKDHQKSP